MPAAMIDRDRRLRAGNLRQARQTRTRHTQPAVSLRIDDAHEVEEAVIRRWQRRIDEERGSRIVIETGFPRVFRPTRTRRIFTEASQLNDMTFEKSKAFTLLMGDYVAAYDALTEQIHQSTLISDPIRALIRMAHEYGLKLEEDPGHAAVMEASQALYTKRTELDHGFDEQLQDLLGAASYEALRP